MISFLLFFGIVLVLCVFFILPGILLWRLIGGSRKLDYHYILGAGLGLAVITFIFVTTAALYHYSLFLMIFEIVFLIVSILILLKRFQRLSFSFDAGEFLLSNKNLVIFFTFVFLFFIVPTFIMVVPFDTDAQGFGFNALAVREGGTSNTLSPFFGDVITLYPPAFFVITAFLSDIFGDAPIHEVMLIFSHLVCFLFVLAIYWFGRRIHSSKFGVMMSLFCVVGTGLLTSALDSHYPTLLGLLFAVFFLGLFFTNLRKANARTTVIAGIFLGAICLTHPDTLVILLAGFIPFYVLVFVSREKIALKEYVVSFAIVPLIGIAVALPWLAGVATLILSKSVIGSDIVHSFGPSWGNWTKIVLYQGFVVPTLAFLGVILYLKKRKLEDIFMAVTIVSIVELSTIGIVKWLGQRIGFDITSNFYPPNIAWAGPIIPFAYFAALFCAGFLKNHKRFYSKIISVTKPLLVLSILVCLLMPIFGNSIVIASKRLPISIFGTFSTDADVGALLWLKNNSHKGAIILNYPLGLEGQWVPVISERKSISNRAQPYFIGFETYADIEKNFSEVISADDKPQFIDLLKTYNISYVTVSQLSVNRSAYLEAQTWKEPDKKDITGFLLSSGHVQKIYDENGAAVYSVSFSK